jgi:hypothetical protein
VTEILEFPVLLRLIDERSAAFRAVIASAPSLDVQVPTSGAVARHQVQEAMVHTLLLTQARRDAVALEASLTTLIDCLRGHADR